MQTLAINLDKARGRVPDAIRQAYCIVVTVSDKNDAQAFRLSVTDEPHFETIKKDSRARVQDTAITAETLLPDGPYDLWKGGETSRRVKDLAGAFAQLPHLPKMLKAQAIVQTLVGGCVQGTFVLKLMRPDRTFRTWWRAQPGEEELGDPALELVLPQAAELGEIPADLLAPKALPSLWSGDEITAQAVLDYFCGNTVVQVDRGSYQEAAPIPKASAEVVNKAIGEAVAGGKVWLLSGPASLLGEALPAGVLTSSAKLRMPPEPIPVPAILPENLAAAWKDGGTNALAIAAALSQLAGHTLPWKTVRDAIGGALYAQFIALTEDSAAWPCDLPAAQTVKVKLATATGGGGISGAEPTMLLASAEFEPSEIQDLAELIPQLLAFKAKAKVALRFHVRIEVGGGTEKPSPAVAAELNKLIAGLKDGFKVN